MSERSAVRAAGVLWVVLLGVPMVATRARADDLPAYRVHATLQSSPAEVNGTVAVSFTNHSARTLTDAVVFLFPNRFSEPDTGINDFNRPFVYPEQDFDPGSMALLEARDGEHPTSIEPLHIADAPDGCAVRLAIAPLAPGATRALTLRFHTVVSVTSRIS
jgi:hypothetical protein